MPAEKGTTVLRPRGPYGPVDDFSETQVTHRTQKAVPKMESCLERIQKVLER